MKRVTKILSSLSTVVLVVVMLIMLFSVYCKINNQVPRIFGHSVLYVSTGSMEPTYPVGSCIVAKKVDPSTLKVGDVICFYSSDPAIMGQPNTHRIVEVNGTTFTTRGDANNKDDDAKVEAVNIIGKITKRIKFMEKIHDFMISIYFYIFFVFVPLILLMIGEITKVISSYKEAKNDTETIKEAISKAGLNPEDEQLIELVKKYGEDVLKSVSGNVDNITDTKESQEKETNDTETME